VERVSRVKASEGEAPPIPGGEVADSFDAFYEAEYWPVVRVAVALTGRWDVAEELVQDAFLALYRRWGTVSSYDAPAAWLRRVVLNNAVSNLRRRATEVRLVARLGHRRNEHAPPPEPPSRVWGLVARLPKRQAQVVVLVHVEDRSVAEVAQILECDETTVRTHLRRARLSLARELAVDTDEEVP
jgi:RNA polymerase sigma-70 factor (ECF subfamily)